MSTFLKAAACEGRRPRHLAALRCHLRSDLISRLLHDRQVARFVVAPDGFGKSSLAFGYAETVFSFKHVMWINGKSPCFLRDLDAGILATGARDRHPCTDRGPRAVREPRARGHRRRPSARLRARLRALGPDRRSARGRLRGPRVLRALPRRIRRAAARPHQARRDGPAAGRRRGGWRRRRRARGRAARRGPAEGIRPHDARLPEGDRAGGASRRGDARDDGDARAARGVARRGGRVRCLRRGGAGPFGARLPVSGDR